MKLKSCLSSAGPVRARLRGRAVRCSLVAGALGLVLAAAAPTALASSPGAGAKGNYRGQCRQLTKQINHYEGTILPMAKARGNAGWERATNAQIERLWHRRADLCPAYGRERTILVKSIDQIKKFNALMAAAGRAAVTYFTGGLGGL